MERGLLKQAPFVIGLTTREAAMTLVNKHHVNKHHGFTLMELMITVAILAVITAIAVPAYNGYMATARKTEGHNNLAALALAQEEYFLENNEYFYGADKTALETASGNLWEATSSDGVFNFAYAVSGTTGNYTATATGTGGKVPTSVVLTISK